MQTYKELFNTMFTRKCETDNDSMRFSLLQGTTKQLKDEFIKLWSDTLLYALVQYRDMRYTDREKENCKWVANLLFYQITAAYSDAENKVQFIFYDSDVDEFLAFIKPGLTYMYSQFVRSPTFEGLLHILDKIP